MSGNSNVEAAGDQQHQQQEEYHEGKAHSHNKLDSKDERSIANRLAAEEQREEPADSPETAALKKDATLPAKMHGNKPSRGAEIDAELQAEDELRLRQKAGK